MGNHLASQSSQIDHTHLHDLPGILYESSLGQGWFLKTLRCIHEEGTVVVKVFVKRDQNLKLDEYEERLKGFLPTIITYYFQLLRTTSH